VCPDVLRELAVDFLNSWPVMIGLCIGLGTVIPLAVVGVLLVGKANRRRQ